MGYSHSWTLKRDLTKDEIASMRAIVCTLATLANAENSKIPHICRDYGDEFFTAVTKPDGQLLGEIHFNGCDADGEQPEELMHETFVFNTTAHSTFCKTAQKPYDAVVCAFLIHAKHLLDDDIEVRSDGNPEDWEKAVEIYEDLFEIRPTIVKEYNKIFMAFGKTVQEAIDEAVESLAEGRSKAFRTRAHQVLDAALDALERKGCDPREMWITVAGPDSHDDDGYGMISLSNMDESRYPRVIRALADEMAGVPEINERENLEIG